MPNLTQQCDKWKFKLEWNIILLIKLAKTINFDNIHCWPRCRETGTLTHCWWEYYLVGVIWQSVAMQMPYVCTWYLHGECTGFVIQSFNNKRKGNSPNIYKCETLINWHIHSRECCMVIKKKWSSFTYPVIELLLKYIN